MNIPSVLGSLEEEIVETRCTILFAPSSPRIFNAVQEEMKMEWRVRNSKVGPNGRE